MDDWFAEVNILELLDPIFGMVRALSDPLECCIKAGEKVPDLGCQTCKGLTLGVLKTVAMILIFLTEMYDLGKEEGKEKKRVEE